MANASFVRGLEPERSMSGNVRLNSYIVTTGQTIYRGDTVIQASTGTVTSGVTTGLIVGVAAETIVDSASAGGKSILVYDDPNTIFSIVAKSTANTSGNEFAAADIFTLCPIYAGAGSATTLLSGYYADMDNKGAGSIGTTALALKIIGYSSAPDNAVGRNCLIYVKLNNHALGNMSGGI